MAECLTRPQKITFGEMRESGVRGVLIYCSDYHCSHHIAASGYGYPLSFLRLSGRVQASFNKPAYRF